MQGFIIVSIATRNPNHFITTCPTPFSSSLSSFSSPSMASYYVCPSRSLSHDPTRASQSTHNVNKVEKLKKQSDKGYVVKKSNSVSYDSFSYSQLSKRL